MSDEQNDAPETPQAPAEAAPAVSGDIPDDAKTMGMLCHLLGLTFIGAIIIWLIKKDDHPFIDQEGKESVNFQITALIGWVIASIASVVTCGIGAILYLPIFVCVLIFCIMGAMKAKDGQAYRYPVCIRFIK